MTKLSYVNGVSDSPFIFKSIGTLLEEAAASNADNPAIVVRDQMIARQP